MTIWLHGTRFRVRDESGRGMAEILEDSPGLRGLGTHPHSIEEMMDESSRARRSNATVTDLFGDLSTGIGVVDDAIHGRWTVEAQKLAPIVNQLIAQPGGGYLNQRSVAPRFGRPATEYQGVIIGDEDGTPFQSEVTQVFSAPYLLFSHVRDAKDPSHNYTREVVSLSEGTVSDADLTPPVPTDAKRSP